MSTFGGKFLIFIQLLVPLCVGYFQKGRGSGIGTEVKKMPDRILQKSP
jgi:hypothetical protein